MIYTTELERADVRYRPGEHGVSVVRWASDTARRGEYLVTFWGDTGQASADAYVAKMERTDRARAMQRRNGTAEEREAARVAKLRRSPYGRQQLQNELEARDND